MHGISGSVLLISSLAIGASALYSSKGDVIAISGAKDFRDNVVKSPSVSIVEFYAPWCGHCKNAAPEVKKAAKALKGVANVVAVDATAKENERLAAEHGVKGFPTFLVFDGSGSSKGKPYNGGRTAKDIAQAAVQAAKKAVQTRLGGKPKPKAGRKPSSSSSGGGGKNRRSSSEPGGGRHVVELTDSNFDALVLDSDDEWMVEFYAPWCGHCKNLSPEWAQMAEDVEGEVKVGAVDATQAQALAQRFGVRGYPTIKMFPAGAGKLDGSAKDYNGPREAGPMTQWALEQLEKAGSAGAPVTELVSDDVLRSKCKGKKICIVAFLPHILDDGKKGREASLKMLEAAAKAQRKNPIRFLWTSSGLHPELEQALGVSMFPTAAAVNLAKSAGALHVGTFDEKGISGFVSGVMTGRARTSPVTIPKLSAVGAWDGEEGKPPADEEEDDFDLQAFLNDEV